MQHLVYGDRYAVVPINSSMLTVTLYSSIRKKKFLDNDTEYSVPFMTLYIIWTVYLTLTFNNVITIYFLNVLSPDDIFLDIADREGKL